LDQPNCQCIPPGITLVNIGAPRMIGVDFNYSF